MLAFKNLGKRTYFAATHKNTCHEEKNTPHRVGLPGPPPRLAADTGRSPRRIRPDIVIDGKGIAPQIPIPHEVSRTEALQERDGIGEEIHYIERVLRGLPYPSEAEQ